ncbi:EcsC family protein [Acinetobacter sp. A3.8]|uniref:EcsC family protein n=1 Tax=Acinetobacter sedimenti TaxID=2919922 RepID=A0A9X2B9C1_9GAMM|nr:EcsC family protein [Acinetobacter sedimenti]MCJ8147054.1 EcsC family protein [Acinetobacter sedimenti]
MGVKKLIVERIRQQTLKVSPLNKNNQQHMLAKSGQVIEGKAQQRDQFDLDYEDIHQLFRNQFPTITKQVLGNRYNAVNKYSKFVLPNGLDSAADEVLELLAKASMALASTERVLAETGAKSIQELQQNVDRSARASSALKEVNKIFAALQGGVSGVAGMVWAVADLPLSVLLALKTIYETGHAYGFELDNEEDQQAVYQVLVKSDLGLIAEKQVLLLGIRNFKDVLTTGNYSQLQSFLDSNYSFEGFKNALSDANGQYKWSMLNVLGKVKWLRYTTPLLGGLVGAFYGVKMIEEVAEKADEIFAHARRYLIDNPEQHIAVLEAYQRGYTHQQQINALAKNDVSALLGHTANDQNRAQSQQKSAQQHLDDNPDIVKVKVEKQVHTEKQSAPTTEAEIHNAVEDLAKKEVATKTVVKKSTTRRAPAKTTKATTTKTAPKVVTKAPTEQATTEKATTAKRSTTKSTTTKSAEAKPSARRTANSRNKTATKAEGKSATSKQANDSNQKEN